MVYISKTTHIPRGEYNMKEFENNIEKYMKKKNIFNNNSGYLLQAILTVSEMRIQQVIHTVTAESAIHRELDIIDTAVKMVFQHGKDSCRKDNKILEKVTMFLEDVDKYNNLYNLASLHYHGRMKFSRQGNKVQFRYEFDKEINKNLEVLNFYNKLNYNQNKNSYLGNKMFKGTKSANPMVGIYNELRGIYLGSIREFNENIVFEKFCLEEFYDVLIAIHTQAYILRVGAMIEEHYIDEYCPLYIDCEKMISRIHQLTKLSYQKIEEIVSILTYEEGQRVDIICTPLLKVKDVEGVWSYLVPTSLLIYSNIERNTIVLLQNKFKEKMNKNSFKEEALIKRINDKLYKYNHIVSSFNKDIFKKGKKEKLTDIDMALYDKENKALLICELKNFIRADTVKEHLNIQGRKENEGLNKAIGQVKKVKEYYSSNKKEFMQKCFNCDSPEDIKEVYFIVISKNNLGNRLEEGIPIIDELNFYYLLDENKGNLKGVIDGLKENILLPKYGLDYIETKEKINFAGYEIYYDQYKIKHRKYV